jgi:hypothetical protein
MFGDKQGPPPERIDGLDPAQVQRFFESGGMGGGDLLRRAPLTLEERERFEAWSQDQRHERSKVQWLTPDGKPPARDENAPPTPETIYINSRVCIRYPKVGSDGTPHPYYGMAYYYEGNDRKVLPTPELASVAEVLEFGLGGVLANINLRKLDIPHDTESFIKAMNREGITQALVEAYKKNTPDYQGDAEPLSRSALRNVVYPHLYNMFSQNGFDPEKALEAHRATKKAEEEAMHERDRHREKSRVRKLN